VVDAVSDHERGPVDLLEIVGVCGDESELGVVQNRLFSKEKKLELSLFAGNLGSDPFLSVQNLGGSVGFHFSEYLGVHVVGWKSFAGSSSALDIVRLPLAEGGLGASANVNKPNGYVGSEIAASILYGKLSLLGKAIIHYDMHVDAGLGVTFTDNGNSITPHVGIGQEIFLSQMLSLRVDYRLMIYREDILRFVGFGATGQYVGTRTNFTNAVTFGIGLKLPVFSKKESQ
jgi:outer membrane beta-barrel protein